MVRGEQSPVGVDAVPCVLRRGRADHEFTPVQVDVPPLELQESLRRHPVSSAPMMSR
jgi:hypothetical protein